MKWIAPLSAYLAVGIGLFVFHSAWGTLLGFHVAIIISLLIAKPNIPLKTPPDKQKHQMDTSEHPALRKQWDNSIFHVGYLWVCRRFPEQIASLGLNTSSWPVFIASFALVNPFIEEYFWRGYLGSKTKSLHISDFLYAGFHGLVLYGMVRVEAIIFGLSMLVFAGWFWRQIAREDEGLLAPLLGHMTADFTILITVYRMTL